MRWATSAAICACVSWPAIAAPKAAKAPTAEGAQQFLAMQLPAVPTQVRFVDSAGRANYVTGKRTGEVRTTKGGLRKTKETIEPLPERFVDKQLTDVRVSEVDAVDAYGRPNACTTRITQMVAPDYDDRKSDVSKDQHAFSFTVTQTDEVFTYESLEKFTSPAQVIDWGNVEIGRSAEHYITVSSKGQAFPAIHLTYLATDADLADRIEYAMRFLAMSCGTDPGAGS
jgi:hypothetical protein